MLHLNRPIVSFLLCLLGLIAVTRSATAEITKIEFKAVEKIAEQANEEAVRELTEIQLALVGGGIGDVVFG